MTKRPKLSDLTLPATGGTVTPLDPARPAPKAKSAKQSGPDYKGILAKTDLETWRMLRDLGTEQDRTNGDLLIEAINLLFAKYGKPQIAHAAKPTQRPE